MRQRASGQGSNSIQVRQFNERVILALLRRLGTASKADLARHANLTANTAGMIVHDLEAAGLIRSEGKRQGDRGQPATLIGLDPAGAYSLGVKIGRRSLDTILVDFSGQVLAQRRRECPFPLPEQALALALEDIAALRETLSQDQAARIAGLGVATPYNMGSWRRELDIPSSPSWPGTISISAPGLLPRPALPRWSRTTARQRWWRSCSVDTGGSSTTSFTCSSARPPAVVSSLAATTIGVRTAMPATSA